MARYEEALARAQATVPEAESKLLMFHAKAEVAAAQAQVSNLIAVQITSGHACGSTQNALARADVAAAQAEVNRLIAAQTTSGPAWDAAQCNLEFARGQLLRLQLRIFGAGGGLRLGFGALIGVGNKSCCALLDL